MPVPSGVLLAELVMSADRLIESARASALASAEPAQGWDAPTILGHVAQVDNEVWGPRFDAMLTAARDGGAPPVLVSWEPDATATAERCAGTSLDDRAAELMAARTRLVSRFRGLGETEWQATAEHEELGTLALGDVLMRILEHDEEHRASLVFADLPGSPDASDVG